MAAVAADDLPKAAALLELLRPKLSAEKFSELNQSLEQKRSRDAEKAKLQAKSDVAATETQSLVIETLRQLQQSQSETSKLIAELRNRPEPQPLPAPAAPSQPPVEVPATANGPMPGTIVVRYGFDSSLLEETEVAKLKPVLQALTTNAKTKVEIRGYADKSGNSNYNLALSGARAQSVKDWLRRAGIETQRIEVVTFGSFQATSATAEEAGDYRKVEVLLLP
ncbi:MAG: OmpA family protein [Roseimicrobium sp.]